MRTRLRWKLDRFPCCLKSATVLLVYAGLCWFVLVCNDLFLVYVGWFMIVYTGLFWLKLVQIG